MNHRKVNWMFLAITLAHVFLIAGLYAYAYWIGPVAIPIIPNLLISQAIIFVPALLFLIFSKENILSFLGFHKIKISTVFMIILFTFLMMPATTVINAISMLFVDNTVAQMSVSVIEMPMLVMVLFMGVLGPVSEEIVCRGAMLNGYKRSTNTFRAILASAILFGVMHMNINQAAYAIFLGLVMAVLVEATGSIWGSIVFHMTVNTWNVALMYFSEALTSAEGMEEAQDMAQSADVLLPVIGIYAVIALITTSIGLCVLVWIAKKENRKEQLSQILRGRKENKGKVISVPLVFAIVIAIAYMILFDIILA